MKKPNPWNEVYSKKGMAAYPDNALIRFVAKYYYDVPNRGVVSFLDLGCGAGSSTWYLAREGFNVVALDGSMVAIERLTERLEKENLVAIRCCCDIKDTDWPANEFDCVVDVSSLCYVPEKQIDKIMKGIHRTLKPNGRIFSITPAEGCAREPFENVADANIKARFMGLTKTRGQFALFRHVGTTKYEYTTGADKFVSLWVTEAQK